MKWILLVITVTFFSYTFIDNQNSNIENPYSPFTSDKELTTELREKICNEYTEYTNDHWAGHYYAGDGLGFNLYVDLAPDSGFISESSSCTGSSIRGYGHITEENNSIQLISEMGTEEEELDVYLHIQWGDRSYLLLQNELFDFCNAILSQREPRSRVHGFFLIRDEDYKKEVVGLPNLPEKYLQYLMNSPINTTITSTKESKSTSEDSNLTFIKTIVEFDVGSNQGVFTGMSFFKSHSKYRSISAEISHVYPNHSIAEIHQYIFHYSKFEIDDDDLEEISEEDSEEKAIDIQLGWVFSTPIPSKENKYIFQK